MSSAATTPEKPLMDRARVLDWLRRRGPALALDLAVNAGAPVLVYDLTHVRWGEVNALLAASGPPVLWSVIVFARSRRLDALSIMALAGIALSLLAFVGAGSASVLLLREKMVTLLIGLAFLGSAAIGKPLIYPLARASLARESAEALAEFDARRNHPMLRRTVMIMTLVWGFGLVVEFAASVSLIYLLSHHTYLVVSPILGYGTMGALVLWTFLYRRHRTRLGRVARGESGKAAS